MKHFLLITSITLTIIVFSMSFASGADSSGLSLEITNFVANILDNIFPNNSIVLEDLHVFVRKSAHITEYFILGISWFFTGKYWGLSFTKILIIGLLIASIDEIIQISATDRGPSLLDTLVFDFIPFTVSAYIFWFFHNRKGEKTMPSNTLARLQNNKITPEAAYKKLYKNHTKKMPFTRRAHFIKLNVKIPGEKGVNKLLRVLFFLPLPIFLVRIIMSFVNEDTFGDDMPFTKSEMVKMITSKGININVNSKSGEKIIIKTI